MLDKTTSSLDRENLHEVFLTMINIQRNNKNKYYFCNFEKKVGFYCFTTSPWSSQANYFNKIHLHIKNNNSTIYFKEVFFFKFEHEF